MEGAASLSQVEEPLGFHVCFVYGAALMIRNSNAVQERTKRLRRAPRKVILLAATASVLFASGWVLHGELHPETIPATTTASSSAVGNPSSALRELASLIETCESMSRPILLGSRDPRGSSCVPVVRSGDIHGTPPGPTSDLDGGPGTRLMTLYFYDRLKCKTAVQDFTWHQGRLKVYLENELASNGPAANLAPKLAEKAQQFSSTAAAWTAWPEGLAPIDFSRNTDWPGYCLTEMDRAAARRIWRRCSAGRASWQRQLSPWTISIAGSAS